MTTPGEYLLGMEPREVERLGRQHEAWSGATTRLLDAARVGVGRTVVDLGCGPGFTTLEIARRVGAEGRVVAVDSSRRATDELRRTLAARGIAHVEVVAAAVDELDFGAWAADVVFARWLFCFLAEPERLVGRIAAGLAPGARLAAMDYAHYSAIHAEPSTPLFERVFGAVEESFAAAGGSLDVAGRLPGWMAEAGLEVESVELLSDVVRPGSPRWRWVGEFLDLYLPTLVEKGVLAPSELGEHRKEWQERERRPGALLFLPPVLGVVAVRG